MQKRLLLYLSEDYNDRLLFRVHVVDRDCMGKTILGYHHKTVACTYISVTFYGRK